MGPEFPSPLGDQAIWLKIEQGAGGNDEEIVEIVVAGPVQFVVADQNPQVGPDGFKILDDPDA